MYKDFNIGNFIDGLKHGTNSQLKSQVEEIFEQKINVTKKIVNLSDEDKLNLCKEFYEEFKKLPKSTQVYKNFNIGSFISSIKQGYNQQLKRQIEKIFNQEIKAAKKISDEDKIKLCKEFYEEFKKLPKSTQVYKNFKIGNFITHLKQGYNQQLKSQVEEIFKQEINAVKRTV